MNKNNNKVEEKPSEVKMLISLGGENTNQPILQRYIDKFNETESSHIRLIPYFVQSDVEAMLKLIYAKETNQNYHIACLGPNQIYSLANMDLIEPLDNFIIKNVGMPWLEQLFPVTMANATLDGKILSIPILRNSRIVIFNKNMLNYKGNFITLEKLLALIKEYENSAKPPLLQAPLVNIIVEYIAYQSPYRNAGGEKNSKNISFTDGKKIDIVDKLQQEIKKGTIELYYENETNSFKDFFSGNVTALAVSTSCMDYIESNASFPISSSILMMDEKTTFPLLPLNLYMVKQNTDLNYDTIWNVMQSIWDVATGESELYSKDHLPLTAPQKVKYNDIRGKDPNSINYILTKEYNGYSNIAVNQNSKINLQIETTIKRIFNQEGNSEEELYSLESHINSLQR